MPAALVAGRMPALPGCHFLGRSPGGAAPRPLTLWVTAERRCVQSCGHDFRQSSLRGDAKAGTTGAQPSG